MVNIGKTQINNIYTGYDTSEMRIASLNWGVPRRELGGISISNTNEV